MNDLLNLAWKDILTFLLVFTRIGIIFALVPFFSGEIVPRKVTAIIAFFLALVLLPIVPNPGIDMNNLNVLTLIVLLVHDLLIGLCIGLSVSLIFSGVQIGGELIGFQMGFSMVNVVDPMTGVDAPITSNLLYIAAFLLFLCLGGHHMLIKALVDSFSVIPIKAELPQQAFLSAIITYAAEIFVIGIKVAAPVIGVLILINVAFAITARAVPQMNVFLMAFPLTISVGLLFLIIVMKFMPGFISSAMNGCTAFIKATLPLY